MSKFDHRAHALAHHAEHLLPILQRIAPERAPHSVPELDDLAKREPEVVRELLSRAAAEPEVQEAVDLQEAVEAWSAPETFEVKPVRTETRAPRKTNEIRARVEPQLAEEFRLAAEAQGMSESEALREAIRTWCRKRKRAGAKDPEAA